MRVVVNDCKIKLLDIFFNPSKLYIEESWFFIPNFQISLLSSVSLVNVPGNFTHFLFKDFIEVLIRCRDPVFQAIWPRYVRSKFPINWRSVCTFWTRKNHEFWSDCQDTTGPNEIRKVLRVIIRSTGKSVFVVFFVIDFGKGTIFSRSLKIWFSAAALMRRNFLGITYSLFPFEENGR